MNGPAIAARRLCAVRWAIGLASAAALIAIDVHLARRVASAPARCADGMVLLGARCCGEGQHLDGARCAGAPTRCAEGLERSERGCVPPWPPPRVDVAGGTLTVAPGDWEASGVVRWHREEIAPFRIDVHEVTEARWSRCVAAGACPALPLRGEPGLPVTGVDVTEAAALCAFEGGRLPTESELAFAAAGPGGRRYPWGRTGFVCRRAAWGLVEGPCAEGASGPEIVGAHPAGATPEGVHDLAGNVAEWALAAPGDGAVAHVVLGGAYDDVEAAALRTWSRRVAPGAPGAGEVQGAQRRPTIGFRCALAMTDARGDP